MTIITYKPNERDKPILEEISALIADSLDGWYGAGSYLDAFQSEIRSYRNCFIIRYPITRSNGTKKAILVKIRRNPKMDSLWRAVKADIHKNIPTEYGSLVSVFDYLAVVNDEFGVIRPLAYIEKYHAIIMEEYPSRTLRQNQ